MARSATKSRMVRSLSSAAPEMPGASCTTCPEGEGGDEDEPADDLAELAVMGEHVEQVGDRGEEQGRAFEQAHRERAAACSPDGEGADAGGDAEGDQGARELLERRLPRLHSR
jgi:hypothetical protein